MSGPVEALGAMLAAVGPMQPGQLAMVPHGSLDDEGTEMLARRIADAILAVARLWLVDAGRAWPPVAHQAVRYGPAQGLPAQGLPPQGLPAQGRAGER